MLGTHSHTIKGQYTGKPLIGAAACVLCTSSFLCFLLWPQTVVWLDKIRIRGLRVCTYMSTTLESPQNWFTRTIT